MSETLDYFVAPERTVTERFIIRSYMPGDGPLLEDVVRSSREHLLPWLSWAGQERTSEDFEHLARRNRGRYLLAEDFSLAVFSPDGRALLGSAGFHLRGEPLGHGTADLGMFMRHSEAGKGLGSAVLVELLRWGFSEWPWRRLSWRCEAENIASRRCAEKAGLAYEGTLRGHVVGRGRPEGETTCYAALRDEWSAP